MVLAAAFALTLAVPKAEERPSLSVKQLAEAHDQYTDRTVYLSGWMLPCFPLSCLMLETRNRAVDLLQRAPERSENAENSSVSLGANHEFDEQVKHLRNSLANVIIEARVTDQCWPKPVEIDPVTGEQVIVVCSDRANEVVPIRLVKIIKAEPLPAEEVK